MCKPMMELLMNSRTLVTPMPVQKISQNTHAKLTPKILVEPSVRGGTQLLTSPSAKAKALYEQLRAEGCHPKDIISISSNLLSLCATELRKFSEKTVI